MTPTRQLLNDLGLPLNSTHFECTPERFEEWLRSATANQSAQWPDLEAVFYSDYPGTITVSGIEFSSICCHHLMPFFGTVDIEAEPDGKLLGLSKYARAVDWFSLRAQTQEQLTHYLAVHLQRQLDAISVGVTIRATHTCMACRGVRRMAQTTTRFVALKDTK